VSGGNKLVLFVGLKATNVLTGPHLTAANFISSDLDDSHNNPTDRGWEALSYATAYLRP